MTEIRMKTALIGLMTALFVWSCTSNDPGSLLQKLQRRVHQTQVCVDNGREMSLEVELIDADHRTPYGDVHVGPHQTRCEYMSIPGQQVVHGTIDAVGVLRPVTPPAWTHMLTPGRGQTMRLRVGSDGVTRFAHSSRIR